MITFFWQDLCPFLCISIVGAHHRISLLVRAQYLFLCVIKPVYRFTFRHLCANNLLMFSFYFLKGTIKKTNETVAIKTFNYRGHKMFHSVLNRCVQKEADILSQMKHRNIVKFFGVDDYDSGKKILAMEFCSGGNLLDHIHSKFPNGLSSTQFNNLCDSLAFAFQHMHEIHIIHRDLKPDNFLVSELSDGQIVYKVSDFGSARVLKPGEKYGSIQGTFEYLSPEKFGKWNCAELGIDKQTRSTFDHTHEMWSIGASLFEAATGQLPFDPKNRRNNIQQMYQMISEKGNDDISAMEIETENGTEIRWQRQLPANCMVEKKERVQRLLAGLLRVS